MARLTNNQRASIASLQAELGQAITAAEGEDYAPSIKADKPTFKQLVKLEDTSERAFGKYFSTLGTELSEAIDWHQYNRAVRQAADIEPMIQAALVLLEDKQKVLVTLSFNMFEASEIIGVNAASNIYKLPVQFEPLQTKINRQAIRYSNELVTQVDGTTKALLRSNLRTSIDLGEDIEAATHRIMNTINDPTGIRARRIARTEPVNSYGRGVQLFGEETGAKGKVVDVVLDGRTSPICRELHAKYGNEELAIPVKQDYKWRAAGGGQKATPGFHVNCRTGHWLLY